MKPQWKPLSFMPTLATHIDDMLSHHQEQYATLLDGKDRPYVLDDYTVQRVINAYTTAKQDLPLFDEQLRRWGDKKVTTAQREEIVRLKGQMVKLHEVVDNVLKLANWLAQGTIERQLAKSDEEIGLEYSEKEKTRLLLAYVMGCQTFASEQAYLDYIEQAKKDHCRLPSGFHWPIAYWDEAIERWLICDQSHDPQPFNPLHDLNAAWQLVERVTHPPKKALGFRSPNVLFSHWWDHAHLWAETKEEAAEAICLAALTCYLGKD